MKPGHHCRMLLVSDNMSSSQSSYLDWRRVSCQCRRAQNGSCHSRCHFMEVHSCQCSNQSHRFKFRLMCFLPLSMLAEVQTTSVMRRWPVDPWRLSYQKIAVEKWKTTVTTNREGCKAQRQCHILVIWTAHKLVSTPVLHIRLRLFLSGPARCFVTSM